MDSLELNKIVAAILAAGVIAMMSGLVASFVVHAPAAPEERAYVKEYVKVRYNLSLNM